jgi:hypothetical protein
MQCAQANHGQHFKPKLDFHLDETNHSIQAETAFHDYPVQTAQANLGRHFMHMH